LERPPVSIEEAFLEFIVGTGQPLRIEDSQGLKDLKYGCVRESGIDKLLGKLSWLLYHIWPLNFIFGLREYLSHSPLFKAELRVRGGTALLYGS
jgi:hypothetical protein